MVWTGTLGYTLHMRPHVGPVPGKENEWMLAGFNGGGMTVIFTAAEVVVAKMVVQGINFEERGMLAVVRENERECSEPGKRAECKDCTGRGWWEAENAGRRLMQYGICHRHSDLASAVNLSCPCRF